MVMGSVSQPTYKRQRFLLEFIGQLKGGVSATDLQKLVFLYTMKNDCNFYEFIPYKFGSYSFQLAEDVSILRKGGFLIDTTSRIQARDEDSYMTLYPIATERGKALIRKAYREYPYYTINSEMIDELFDFEEAQRFYSGRAAYTQDEQILFTIGYEGKSVESFINILIKNNVRMLVDVRKNSLSRKFGFSRGKLEHIAETAGIRYLHIPELGIDSDKRTSLNTRDDYEQLFCEYEKTLPQHLPQINQVYSLLCANTRIALMCFEKDSQMCHRHVLRDYLLKAYDIRSIDL